MHTAFLCYATRARARLVNKRQNRFVSRLPLPRKLTVVVAVYALILLLTLAETVPRVTETPGTRKHTSGKVTVDYSNAKHGYVAVRHSGTSTRLKARVARSSSQDTYDLNGEGRYEVFPLKYGSGTYTVSVWQNVGGSRYAQVYANSFKATLDDELICYLYPNQYVWFDADSQALVKAQELCAGLTDDMEKITAVYNFVKDDIKYDYIKALTVASGYMPDVDDTLASGKGICFDQASLLACMLRSQGIPTQIVIGMLKQTQYHAWNKVYVNGQWRMLDATFAGKHKSTDYEEERAY